MAVHLLLAPAAAGKTHQQLHHVRAQLQAAPLAPVWVIVPDRHQATAFRRRLAEQGGALGAQVGTFGDLYQEVLAQAAQPTPIAPEPVIHRLLRTAVDTLASQQQLPHYHAIRQTPGFIRLLSDLVAELKRARIRPEAFQAAVQGQGPRLTEVAALYGAYQQELIHLDWADPEGLSWLAVDALTADPQLFADVRLLVMDGFDSFDPTKLAALRLLAARIPDVRLSLSGTLDGSNRIAHRRFARTLTALTAALAPTVERLGVLPPERPTPLQHLENGLFEPSPGPMAAGPHITFLAAQTPALEAREAVRWLKAQHRRQGVPLAECAIVARDLSPYQPFLRAAAQEFGVPLQFASGEPLSANPAIAAWLTALALPLTQWPRRPLLDTLRSPYFNWQALGLDAVSALQLEAVARWGQVIGGENQWQATLARLAHQTESREVDEEDAPLQPPRLPQGATAQTLWQRLQAFMERLTPPATATLTTFVDWLETLLADCQLEARAKATPATATRDQTALIKLNEILRALVLSDAIVADPHLGQYADFYNELRGAVSAATYQPEFTPTASIYAASLSAARGVPYQAVVVLGLAEGVFPAPLSEDPLLSDLDRAALQAQGLPLEPRLRSEQQTLFYEAVTRATRFLLLTRPYLAADGEDWKPSPYWEAAQRLFETEVQWVRPQMPRPLADAASPTELLAQAATLDNLPPLYAEFQEQWAQLQHRSAVLHARLAATPLGAHEGLVPGLSPLLTARYGPQQVWSASRLETYGVCGFRFFVGTALSLAPRLTPQAGLDAAQRGGVFHAILERVYQAATDPTDLAAVLAALPTVAQQVFEAAPHTFGFRPTALWEQERAEMLAILVTTLTALAETEAGFRPTHFEQKFGFADHPPLAVSTPAGTMLFHGVIDRIDVNAAGALRVLDYKTGASGIGPQDLAEGRRLQIALYALAALQLLPNTHLDDAFYWGINGAAPSRLGLSAFEHQTPDGQKFVGVAGALELVKQHLAQHGQNIQAGRFAPTPPRTGCPTYCPAQTICWRYTPAAY